MGKISFLVDMNVTKRLAIFLREQGYVALHPDLDHDKFPAGKASADNEIIAIADAEGHTAISQDNDFKQSYLKRNAPRKLIFVKVGNMEKKKFVAHFEAHFPAMLELLEAVPAIVLTMEGVAPLAPAPQPQEQPNP